MSCLLAGLMAAIPSYAFELEFFDGDLTVEIGNELNYGVSISTQKASKRYIYGLPPGQNPISFTAAQATQRQIDNGDPVVPMRDQIVVGNGGRAGLASLDDGRLAYSRGVYQNQARGITDIKSNWGDFGARVKLLYFYDTEFVDEKRNIHPGTKQEVTTSSRVNRLMGRDLTTREMFAYWDGYVGDIPITVRVGDQVISWGQSQFAPGIDQINPLDINNLLIPSLSPSNAREPIGMALINVVPTDWLSLEAFYQYDRAIIGAPPAGTFFSLADVAGAGVSDFAGLGRLCAVTTTDAPYDSDGALSPFGAPGACTPLQETWFPDSGGQFGLNVGFQLPFIPMLSSFQFNAYYVRHHARVPIIGARKSGIIPNAVPCTTTRAALVISPDDEGRRFGQALSSTTGGDAQDPACLNQAVFDQTNWDPADFLQLGFVFPEDQEIFGFSWRGPTFGGAILTGEIAYRKDTPVQVSPQEILSATGFVALNGDPNTVIDFAAPPFNLTPAELLALQTQLPLGGTTVATAQSARESDNLTGDFLGLPSGISCLDIYGPDINFCNQQLQNGRTEGDGFPGGFDGAFKRGVSTLGTPAEGYVNLDVVQATTGILKLIPNVLGAERMIALLELSYMKVRKMPTRFNLATTDVSCTQYLSTCVANADSQAWGYRLLTQLNYDNFLDSGLQLQTRMILFHDVKGYVPDNLLLFKEGRKNIVLDFELKYRNFITSLRFLGFTGAKNSNTLADRDTVHLNFQYVM